MTSNLTNNLDDFELHFSKLNTEDLSDYNDEEEEVQMNTDDLNDYNDDEGEEEVQDFKEDVKEFKGMSFSLCILYCLVVIHSLLLLDVKLNIQSQDGELSDEDDFAPTNPRLISLIVPLDFKLLRPSEEEIELADAKIQDRIER